MNLIKRRHFIITSSLAFITKTAKSQEIAVRFSEIERQSGGILGTCIIDTEKGKTLTWRANSRFPFCSSIKWILASFVLWKADHGIINIEHPVQYNKDDLLPWSPITRTAVDKGALSFLDLCEAAVTLSDNTAANLLWRETGGPKALMAWLKYQGDTTCTLSSIEPDLNISRYGDWNNTTTPRAMAEDLKRFILGDILMPESRKKLTHWLISNTTGSRRLRAGLPPSWKVGDKTGTYNEKWFSTIDIGIVWPPKRQPLIISGFVANTSNTAKAEQALAKVAKLATSWIT